VQGKERAEGLKGRNSQTGLDRGMTIRKCRVLQAFMWLGGFPEGEPFQMKNKLREYKAKKSTVPKCGSELR